MEATSDGYDDDVEVPERPRVKVRPFLFLSRGVTLHLGGQDCVPRYQRPSLEGIQPGDCRCTTNFPHRHSLSPESSPLACRAECSARYKTWVTTWTERRADEGWSL